MNQQNRDSHPDVHPTTPRGSIPPNSDPKPREGESPLGRNPSQPGPKHDPKEDNPDPKTRPPVESPRK